MTNSRSQTFISDQPVTVQRKPFAQNQDGPGVGFPDPGTARASIAATPSCPKGTTKDNWAAKHSHQTVLQQHCSFFDRDNDGVIWPLDTFRGFYALGFNVFLCVLSVFVIHANFSYPTCPTWIPDPFFRVYTERIHKDKHGSDTGTYDTEGRFVPQRFEDIFAKYAPADQDGLTLNDIWLLLKGQRVILDPIGWFGAFFEWIATYLLLWPEDGVMKKEDIRRVFDGSIFFELEGRNNAKIKKTE
ncbi:hypothetical protein BX616_006670 [Lobosporangium transversale]|uniref:Caleosin domain-containing protein n=1 Tax=Lobosporangium transversale TaxID=64571 RepID=A0A1Y2GET9_9FUNG|nr:caleosin domain-containing protein [Lobosporangium transversale]KAF9896833.1 hypothetical protein BX616_006670 [Lobosporangium transversale]ORZ07512.1 caleosin domain-containing protein [Lobosporangium transversale]|eukprot:XP_021878019.1 caleosin domain-containing protein [Lobosporangium transversale]